MDTKLDSHLGLGNGEGKPTAEPPATDDAASEEQSEVIATVATVGVVGLGVAVFEAALLPGLVLGVAAMWAPQYFPKMGKAFRPLFRSTVRGAYKMGQKTKEFVAEAQEQMHDIVAEVRAEDDMEVASPKRAPASSLDSPAA